MKNEREHSPLHEVRPPHAWRLLLIVAGLVAVGVLAGVVWLGPLSSGPAAPPVPERLPPLSPEAQAYLSQIEITDIEMSRWANFLGQEVIYLDVTITNRGPRTIRALELTLEFQDIHQGVVLRESARAIGTRRPSGFDPRAAPLAPGQSRDFRAGFEDIPNSWSRLPPRIQVSGLLLH